MAVCRIIETGATPEQYEQVHLRVAVDENRPPGALIHIAAKAEDGKIRVIEVWETREQAEQWGGRCGPSVRSWVSVARRLPRSLTSTRIV